MQTKSEVITDLQKVLTGATKTIEDLKGEVRRLRQPNSTTADEPQRVETSPNQVSTNHLVTIHRRNEGKRV